MEKTLNKETTIVKPSKEEVLRLIEEKMGVKFSEAQTQAIYSHGKPLNILSCAGSGKTTTLIGKMLFMEMYYEITPSKILAITFNNDAIADLESRYFKVRKSLNLNKRQKTTFKTYHALYYLLLKSKFTDVNWDSLVDYKRYLKKLEYLVRKNVKKYDDETLETLMGIRGYQVNNLLSYEELQKTPKFLVAGIDFEGYVSVVEAYEEMKKEANVLDFDDLQVRMYNELKTNKELLAQVHRAWDYTVVDEYQDISKVQLEILKLTVKDKNKLTAIGDDDQSIYEFRGSKTDYIVDFSIHFLGAERVVMGTNYRVPENILMPVTYSIENNKKRVQKKMEASEKGGNLNYIMTEDSSNSAFKIREEIKKLINNGEKLSDIVILIRNNSQQRLVLDALLEDNIPVSSKSNYMLNGHMVVRDIESIIKMAIDEKDETLFGANYKKVMKFVSNNMVKDTRDKMKFDNSSWREHLLVVNNPSVHEASSMLYRVEGMVQNGDSLSSIIEVIQPLYREYLKYMVSRGMDPKEIGGVLSYLKEAGKEKTFEEFYKSLHRKVQLKSYFEANGDDSVKISTMHRMKGLEYAHVFLLDLTEDVVPNNAIEEQIRFNYGEKYVEDYIEQERRLFYVAWTRAKENLYVLVNTKNPSRFILETINGIRNEMSVKKAK